MAVLIREPPRVDGPTRRVSLRSSVDELDVSPIARLFGGGGHRQAAGFSSELPEEEITKIVVREFVAASSARDGATARA
jgi:phosphoesterase RecJ-like protein